jgi:hypothetical protein
LCEARRKPSHAPGDRYSPAASERGRQPTSGPIPPVFRLTDFPAPLRIDNWYSPMKTDTRIVIHELEDGECKVNDVVVTDKVKHDFRDAYAGIAARVVLDRMWSDPQCNGTRHLLLENTSDWYGQDRHGNLWYFGEKTVARDRTLPAFLAPKEQKL